MSLPTESEEAAEEAGLRWVSDAEPGFHRRRQGERFAYRDERGAPLTEAHRRRAKALAIPPAWTSVWICYRVNGHIQATGRDDRGRKQYIYHQDWKAARDETKYHRMRDFGRALPRIRTIVRRDLRRHGLPRERVIATIVQLLDSTAIRIGNEQYASENGSFGLTTLRNRHARVSASSVRFVFPGKGGKHQVVECADRRIANVLARCHEVPGQRLFQYLGDEGERHAVHSEDINDYLRDIAGESFTAKDFRTWNASVLAARLLAIAEPPGNPSLANREVSAMLGEVASVLGNTPAVCRKSYVDPRVIEAHLNGSLHGLWRSRHANFARSRRDPWERLFLALLESWENPSSRVVTRSKAKPRQS